MPRGREIPELRLPPWTASGPIFPDGIDHHPAAEAFDAYWRTLCRAQGGLPPVSALKPADIPTLLPGLFIVDVHAWDRAGGWRFRYRLCGTEQAIHDGVDITGLWVDEAHPTAWAEAIESVYYDVIATHCPHYWSRTMLRAGQEHQWIERLLVPLSQDGTNVTSLAGHVTWL